VLKELSTAEAERDVLACRVASLQQEQPRRAPDLIDVASGRSPMWDTFHASLAQDLRFTSDEPQSGMEEQLFTEELQQSSITSSIVARKTAEHFNFSETAPASSFYLGTFVMPTPAV
jgi:hypothetical protein